MKTLLKKDDLQTIIAHFPMIMLCFIAGTFSSILSGIPGMVFGGILSAGLAAVIPVVTLMKQRGAWSIKNQVIAGGIAGLIIGFILLPTEQFLQQAPKLFSHYAWKHTTLFLLWAPVAYGIMVHLAYALYYRYKTGRIIFFILVYAGFALGGFIALLPLVLSLKSLLMVFFAPWFNNFLLAICWTVTVRCFDPMPPPKTKVKKEDWLLLLLCILFLPGASSMFDMHTAYKDELFKHENQNRSLLAKSSGFIYASKGFVLPDNKRIWTYENHFHDNMPDSPDGNKKVSLEKVESVKENYLDDDEFKLVVTDKKSGKKLLEKTDTYLNEGGVCWTLDSNSIIISQKFNKQYIMQKISLDGSVEELFCGICPRLAEKTGDIAFVHKEWLYLYKPKTGRTEKKRPLSISPSKFKDAIDDYDISPDAKMIVVKEKRSDRANIHLRFITIYSLDENVPGYMLYDKGKYYACLWFENIEKFNNMIDEDYDPDNYETDTEGEKNETD